MQTRCWMYIVLERQNLPKPLLWARILSEYLISRLIVLLSIRDFSFGGRSVVAGGARGGHGPPCNQICRKLSEKADLVGKVEIFTSNF